DTAAAEAVPAADHGDASGRLAASFKKTFLRVDDRGLRQLPTNDELHIRSLREVWSMGPGIGVNQGRDGDVKVRGARFAVRAGCEGLRVGFPTRPSFGFAQDRLRLLTMGHPARRRHGVLVTDPV